MSYDYPEEGLVWVDTETDGLDAHTENSTLLQVACLVTDVHLNVLDENGYAATIHHSPERIAQVRANAAPVVRDMHDHSGLWQQCADSNDSIPLDIAETELDNYIRSYFPRQRTAWLAGNSLGNVDKPYLSVFMPKVTNHLHYRMLDVSSLAGVAGWWRGVPPYQKTLAHTAMSDIRESLAELRYLRNQLGLDRPLCGFAQ